MSKKSSILSTVMSVLVMSFFSGPTILYLFLSLEYREPVAIITLSAALIVAIIVNYIFRQKNMVKRILISLFVIFAIISMLLLVYIVSRGPNTRQLETMPYIAFVITIIHFAPIGFYMLIVEFRNRHTPITESENNHVK